MTGWRRIGPWGCWFGPVNETPTAPPERSHLARYGTLYAALVYCGTRIVVGIAAWTAPLDRTRPDADRFWWHDLPTMRWDAGHYLNILREGYTPHIDERIAFFPGYPLLTRPLVWAGVEAGLALVIVAHAGGLVCVLLFERWCRHYAPARIALSAVLLYCTYPAAMFFSAAYADGVFLAFVAAALLLLARRRLALAALASAAATLTRPNGVAIAAVVTLSALAHGRARGRPRAWLAAGAIGLLSIAGVVAHWAYLWHTYGRPDAYLAAQSAWEQPAPKHPWRRALTLYPVVGMAFKPVQVILERDWPKLLWPDTWNYTFNLAILVVAVIGLSRPSAGGAQRSEDDAVPRPAFLLPWIVFMMAYLPDPVTGGRLLGIARYQLIALPCFLQLAIWLGDRSRGTRIATSPSSGRWFGGLRLRGDSVLRRFGGPWVLASLSAALLILQCAYVRLFANWVLVS
jgi:hypothetical protein